MKSNFGNMPARMKSTSYTSMPSKLTTISNIDTSFGTLVRDSILQRLIDTELACRVVATRTGARVVIDLLSKQGAIISSAYFEIDELDRSTILNIKLDHEGRKLDLILNNGYHKYCDLSPLYNMIDKETADRKEADTILLANIIAESNRALARESEIDTRVANEETRAKAKEEVLLDNINTEHSQRIAADTTLQVHIDNERDRAIAKENELSTSISSEVTRAKATEDVLLANINLESTLRLEEDTKERQRAVTAERLLDSLIQTEKKSRIKSDTQLDLDITTERKRANDLEQNIKKNYVNSVGHSDTKLTIQNIYDGIETKKGGIETSVDVDGTLSILYF